MTVKHTVPPHINPPELVEKLVTENLALVNWVMRVWFHGAKYHEDLVAYGNLGLVKAARRWNPLFGVKFSTYAVQTVRREIIDGMRTAYFPIHIPDSALKAVFSGEEIESTPFARRAMKVQSITTVTPTKPTPQKFYDEYADIDRALRSVPERHREVVIKRYGLQGHRAMSVTELAEEGGVSKQRICQLLCAAYKYLSNFFTLNQIDPLEDREDDYTSKSREYFRTASERERAYRQDTWREDSGGNGSDHGTIYEDSAER